MQITKREFLKNLALGSAAVATGAVKADEYVPDLSSLPKGSCGDPNNVWFGKHIFPLEPTMTDNESCSLVNGEVWEPAKKIPIFHQTDVVVVGGGPAGFAAAIAAARGGAKVALVERYGSLGGLFTNGMVLLMMATGRLESSGKWTLVTRGICEEFMRKAEALGPDFCTRHPGDRRHWQPTVDPEAAKYLMDKMIAESGVEMFFHSWGVDVIQKGDKVQGVVFESKEGRQAILAKEIVDCTGDADMLFRAGGSYRQITHSIGFVSRWANVDRISPDVVGFKHGNEGNPSTHWANSLGPKGNGLSVRELSAAEVLHRRENWEKVTKLRATKGYEKLFTANTCSQIGPRATRLVDTREIVGRKELFEKTVSNETIGWCGHDGAGVAFAVPWGQIVPKKLKNLLVAGRCLGKGDTVDVFRLICPCFVTGQAAGVAAALAVRKGISSCDLDYPSIRRELLKQDVYL